MPIRPVHGASSSGAEKWLNHIAFQAVAVFRWARVLGFDPQSRRPVSLKLLVLARGLDTFPSVVVEELCKAMPDE
jgi:hypothetical protein